ncbi:MAG: discoidin domain-containing protein [Armatimonadetes bacterium]|nr:discoidin domain-containing protein [Armatimonadota bacterium]
MLPTLALLALTAAQPHRTDWMRDAGWGVFTHYLTGAGMSADDWNKRVDAFDVPGLVKQLETIGCRYYFLTLGQNSGHYCSPNAAYDAATGISPSKCSKRDLVAELAVALETKGIRMCVYLPAGAPNQDAKAMAGLEWTNGPHRNANFQRKWEAVIREWSLRWGKRVHAWWFDGCYWPDAMYRFAEAPNFASFAAAAKAGNPDSLVAFNPGVINPIICQTQWEDFTAGEINEPGYMEHPGRWVVAPQKPGETDAPAEQRRAQYQMLSYLGPTWCASPPRFTVDRVAEYTRDVMDHQGVVTWDVPIGAGGLIPKPFFDQLVALHASLAGPRPPKTERPVTPPGNLAFRRPAQLLSLDGLRTMQVNSGTYHPKCGVDGDPGTFALAGGEWPWSYHVDLEKAQALARVVITFAGSRDGPRKTGYPTEYAIRLSADGLNWTEVAHVQDAVGGKVEHTFAAVEARYVRVLSIKPDAADQPGGQMAVAELEVYGP